MGKRYPGRRDFLRAGSLLALPAVLRSEGSAPDVVIENADLRLVIGGDGTARSLIEKSTGQECLAPGVRVPAFETAQETPMLGQATMMHAAGAKRFPAARVRRVADRLFVEFGGVPYMAVLRIGEAPGHIALSVDQIRTEGQGWKEDDLLEAPLEELVFLQLPLRERAHFGSWLNVMWDKEVAVNLLAADPWCRIDSQPREGYRLVRAGVEKRVRMTGVAAALVATRTARLLDRIDAVERRFNLPRGVESRRRKEYRQNYYWGAGVTPATIDRHIQYARKAGLPMMMMTYSDFANSAGHFPFRPEYPRGMDDLRAVVAKIRQAGMTAGLHFHYCKATKSDPYFSGTPDHRLQMARVFTLASPLDAGATAIEVVENPAGSTLDDDRRILKIASELIAYEGYTTSPPYRFTGCRRGQFGTRPASRDAGIMFGLLDVDTWTVFVRFNQNTTIQQEVASRLGELYRAGFEFVYYDGAEDVHSPFWFTTPWAQAVVHRNLRPAPLFAEGAQRAHFNWHILSRSTAYDTQEPEAVKEAMRQYQEVQAPRTADDFTSVNFGWMGYRAPDARSIGTQPDMVEYVLSRAAGWDCAFSISPRLDDLDANPRTDDNLEIIRRWQEVVDRGWLTDAQKQALRDPRREHTLLRNEGGGWELVPCEQIAERPLRAFLFERLGKTWVVYWHTAGQARYEIGLGGRTLVLEAAGRKYLDCGGCSKSEVARAFGNARPGPA